MTPGLLLNPCFLTRTHTHARSDLIALKTYGARSGRLNLCCRKGVRSNFYSLQNNYVARERYAVVDAHDPLNEDPQPCRSSVRRPAFPRCFFGLTSHYNTQRVSPQLLKRTTPKSTGLALRRAAGFSHLARLDLERAQSAAPRASLAA